MLLWENGLSLNLRVTMLKEVWVRLRSLVLDFVCYDTKLEKPTVT